MKKWIIDPAGDAPLAVIEDTEDGNGVCTLDPEKLPSEQGEQAWADARLIAAAPEMLEWLKEGLYRFDCECDNTHEQHGTRCWHCDVNNLINDIEEN